MSRFAHRFPVFWAYLYFCYFSFAYQFLVYVAGMASSSGMRQAVLMSGLWLIPLLIWPKHSKKIAAVIGVILWLSVLVGLGYWLIFHQDFSQSVIFIIFESNLSEGSEFVSSYFHWWYLAVFLAYGLIPFLMWRAFPPMPSSGKRRATYGLICSLFIIWPYFSGVFLDSKGLVFARNKLLQRLEPAAPWNLVVAYISYQEELNDMQKLLDANSQLPPLKDFSFDPDLLPDTLVLVIGEATNRQRMGLYGYSRNTTPRLDAMEEELVVFKDVVSPRPYTIEALQQVLSFADEKSPQAFFEQYSLLNIMRQAGFEITWITNQQTQTKRNTMLVTLSQMADHHVYLNNNRTQNASQFDGDILPHFQKALDQTAKKQLIVVHLLGTHRNYAYRYPKDFEKFIDNVGVPEWVSSYHLNEYNNYDNAVLYNDSVVADLIDTLKAHGQSALFVYFSDHGEEVYDYKEKQFAGRNEASPTAAMYTIPLIVWASPSWQGYHQVKSWQQYTNRSFSSADLFYTLPDMIGIHFEGLDNHRSLVSENFVKRPRWIGDPAIKGQLKEYESIVQKEDIH